MTVEFRAVERLDDDPVAFDWMNEAFVKENEGGAFKDRLGPNGAEHAIIAFKGDQILGILTFFFWQDERGWIDLFYVAETSRGLGIGRKLLDIATNHLFAAGAKDVQFGTFVSNAAMKALGANAGFTQGATFAYFRKNAL